ncbi:MAG: hypothetical protein KDB69_07220, partial [Acidimicrobiia bacterium]|nr:hypothetical protein [Acidimicrobiia bacterium]
GGSQLSATRAITAVLTPGVRLIEFPGVASSAPITLVEGVSPVVNTLERTLAVPLAGGPIGPPFEGLPYESHEPNRIALTDDASLVIDDVVVDDDWGLITWSVESDRDIVVQPEFFIEYEGSDTDGNLALLVPSHSLGPRFGQSQPPSEPGFATAGIAQLSRLGPHITDSNPPTGLALYWNIRWTEPTSMTATIDAAPVFE